MAPNYVSVLSRAGHVGAGAGGSGLLQTLPLNMPGSVGFEVRSGRRQVEFKIEVDARDVINGLIALDKTTQVLPTYELNQIRRRWEQDIQSFTPIGPPRDLSHASSGQGQALVAAIATANARSVGRGPSGLDAELNRLRGVMQKPGASISFKGGPAYLASLRARAHYSAQDLNKAARQGQMMSERNVSAGNLLHHMQGASSFKTGRRRAIGAGMRAAPGLSGGWDSRVFDSNAFESTGQLADSIFVECVGANRVAELRATSLAPYAAAVEDGFWQEYEPVIRILKQGDPGDVHHWVHAGQLGAYQWTEIMLELQQNVYGQGSAGQRELEVEGAQGMTVERKPMIAFKRRARPYRQAGAHMFERGSARFYAFAMPFLEREALHVLDDVWYRPFTRKGIEVAEPRARGSIEAGVLSEKSYQRGQFIPRGGSGD